MQLGVDEAARFACVLMAAPQLVVIALLAFWGHGLHAVAVAALLLGQFALMRRLLQDPRAQAPFYNATGTTLYVLGMAVSAFALSS